MNDRNRRGRQEQRGEWRRGGQREGGREFADDRGWRGQESSRWDDERQHEDRWRESGDFSRDQYESGERESYSSRRGQGQFGGSPGQGYGQGGEYRRGDYGRQQPGQSFGPYSDEQYRGSEYTGWQYGEGMGRGRFSGSEQFSGGQPRGMSLYGGGQTGAWQQQGQQGYPGGQSFRGKGPKGYQRSDERLKEQVCDRLSDDHQVDASEITVDVRQGEVTLTGTVNSREEKRAAEECVESVSGVTDVINQLRVSRGESGGQFGQSAQSGQTTQSGRSQSQPGSQSGKSGRSGSEV